METEKRCFYCTQLSLVEELQRAGMLPVKEIPGQFFPGQRVWLFELTPRVQQIAKAYYDSKGKPYPHSLGITADNREHTPYRGKERNAQ